MILEINSMTVEELFDKMPTEFKCNDICGCYWELYKADVKDTRYYIRICSETPYKEIKRFDSKNIIDVLKNALKWILTHGGSAPRY